MIVQYALLAAGALTITTVPAAPVPTGPVDPAHMTGKEIRAYNANFDRKDPQYIRCVSQEQIGSLVQTNYICRTNRQWKEVEETANKDARDTVEAMNRQSTNGR